MKICVSGKGGVGKTTLAGVLARLISREGEVIAIDADPDYNLHNALGISPSKIKDLKPLSEMKDLIKERTGASPDEFGTIFRLNPKTSDLPEKIWIEDGNLKYILLGTVRKGGAGCQCPTNVLLQSFLRSVFLKPYKVIVDMEAGIEHLGRGTAKYSDLMIVVVEPTLNAVETGKNIKRLGHEIGLKKIFFVGNKIYNHDDRKFISQKLENVLGYIPYDEKVREAEKMGISLMEFPDSKVVGAVLEIKKKLEEEFYGC